MRNPSVILVILSVLFIAIPIIQQMIKVKQESKLVLLTDSNPDSDESASEYDDIDQEDLNVLLHQKNEFHCFNSLTHNPFFETVRYKCGQKLESPPPKA